MMIGTILKDQFYDKGSDVFRNLRTGAFGDFDVDYEASNKTIWCSLKPNGPPRFTEEFMKQIAALQNYVFQLAHERSDLPLLFCVSMSQIPGVYNFGGDLPFFVECVRNQDSASLRRYAHACVELVYGNSIGWGSQALTIALVQGDALGGGFEAAISHNLVIAERSAKMGMPEVLFNSFPGMGAHCFLSRKLGAGQAERMIMSGKVYTAGEMYDLGLVDVLAEDGKGLEEVRRFVGNSRRYEVLYASRRVRERIQPITLDELRDVADIWVENAMKIQSMDLRMMERLVSAQMRRLGGVIPTPVQ